MIACLHALQKAPNVVVMLPTELHRKRLGCLCVPSYIPIAS